MTAARASTDPRDRLVVELLARTGMFSRGHPLWRKSVLRVCAAQRLME